MKLHYFRLRTERVIDLNTLTVDTIVHHRQTYTVFVFCTTRLFSLFSYHEFIKSPPIHQKKCVCTIWYSHHQSHCFAIRAEPKCSKKRCQTNWECYFRIRESICCRCIAHAQIKHLKNICDCIPTNKNVFSFEMTVYLLAICRLHLRFSRTHTNRSIWYWLQPASVVQHVQHSLNKIFMLCWNETLYIGRSFQSVLLS